MTATTRRISADNLNQRLAIRARRRTELSRRHHRRPAGTAGRRLRRAAPVRGQRLPRAAHSPGDHASVAGCRRGQARAGPAADDPAGLLGPRRARPGLRPAGWPPGARPRPARRAARRCRVPAGLPVSAALAAREDAIAAKSLAVRHDSARAGVRVEGSQPLLSRMVDNVIGNAVGHNRDGGWIHVTTHRWRPGAADRRHRRRRPRPGPGRRAVPAVPPARRRPHRLRPRSRARPVHRRGDRRRPPRIPAPARQPRRRPRGHDHPAPGTARRRHRLDPQRVHRLRRHRLRGTVSEAPSPRHRLRGPGRSPGVRVLVVEDSHSLADGVAEGLRDQGLAVDLARDGLEAAAKLDVNAYDVVVLDRDLPGIHGDTLCQMITARDHRAMVLMLTAAGSAGGPGQRPRPRRRRLPPQAVPLPRARAAHPRPRPPPARRPRPRPARGRA